MHYCDCKGTTKLQLLQRVFQRMLTNIQMGEDLTVQFDIDAREYNAKWYNDFRAYNVIRGQQIPQPVQPAKDDLPFYPNNESFPFQENGDDGGDLPF